MNNETIKNGVRRGWWVLLDEYIPKIERTGTKVIRPAYEKYGTLRLDVDKETAEVSAILDELEEKSKSICEMCGNPATIRENRNGWLKALCDICL